MITENEWNLIAGAQVFAAIANAKQIARDEINVGAA